MDHGDASRPRKAALYARRSKEDAKNPGKSIGDQLREARREAEARGYIVDPALEFSDEGISASRYARGKARPGFDALVAAIEAGQVDVLVVAEISRASRRISELGRVLELCADSGTRLVVGGREVDPSDPADLLLSTVEGGMAAGESARLSLRSLRGARGTAQAGKPSGKNLYGYRRVYDPANGRLLAVEPVPAEADVIQEVARRLLAGESLRETAALLNARGEPSPYDAVALRQGRDPKGAEWSGMQVKRLATNPAYAGLRFHHPEKHKSESKPSLTQAIWPAIIDRPTHERLVVLLGDPARRTNGSVRPGAVVHWLSGIAQCGVCGSRLRVLINRHRYRTYTCFAAGCMKVGRAAGPLEDYVAEHIFAVSERPEIVAATSTTGNDDGALAAAAELDALILRQDEVRRLVASGTYSPEDGAPILALLRTDIQAAQERLQAVALPRRAADLDLQDLRLRWEAYSPARKREIARALVKVEVLSMNGRKTRKFDPAFVRVSPAYAPPVVA